MTRWLDGAFPLFTAVWIVVPLIAVWRSKHAGSAGFRSAPWRLLLPTLAVNLGGLLLLAFLVEPRSHTCQRLHAIALSSNPPDTNFAWRLRFPRVPALAGMALYSPLPG